MLLLKKYRIWKRYKKTYDELSQMSDRDLNDIGIRRYEISDIAREAANEEAA
jgi:uncharacterized protein YjiS (DUF1127 family)